MSSIGTRIVDLRKKQSITQQKLAEIACVDYNTLRKIETGKTKNPGHDIIEKIATALNVSQSAIIEDPKPNVLGGDTLPFHQLSPEKFEKLITWILERHPDFTDIEPYGGRGDKNRDTVAKKIINDKKSEKNTLFQSKRYQKITSSVLIDELKGIKKHFFGEMPPSIQIESIIFCLADSPSSNIKDKVKEYALGQNLPEPIFWEARTLDILCRQHQDIMNEFFGGHIEEVKKSLKDLNEQVGKGTTNIIEEIKTGKNLVEENAAVLRNIDSKLVAFSAADDAEMQRARRLIADGKHKLAQEILLTLREKVENSGDKERLKKLYNNLGLCYTKNTDKEDIKKGIELLEKALDIDNDFSVPKRNLIEVIINQAVEDRYKQALDLGKKLYEAEPDNLEHISLYIHSLITNSKRDEAKGLLNSLDELEEKISKSESFCIAAILLYFGIEEDMEIAAKYVDIGLKSFPDSVPLNRFKGSILMFEAEQKGYGHLGDDALPVFKDLTLVTEAVNYFQKALSLMETGNWPEFMVNQIRLFRYNALALLHKGRKEKLLELDEYGKKISNDLLSKDEKRNKILVDISTKLLQKDFLEAYNLAQVFIEEYNCTYTEIKKISRNFLQHASPEYAIKILSPMIDEAKEEEDFEYWALLSQCYVLVEDKNSALRIMNEAKSFFASKDSETYNSILSHYGAVAARYKDNSESERMVENISELQKKLPDEKILTPIKAIEEDGSLSTEIKEFFEKAKNDFQLKRDLFKTNPVPVYFLTIDRMFGRSFPEVMDVPRGDFDFDFVIPYNQLDKDFLEKQRDNFQSKNIFALDYSALLNFSRTGQLGLFAALGKKVVASEYLLNIVQHDLIVSENPTLRDAWNFLRSDSIELFTHREITDGSLPRKMRDFFENQMRAVWLAQEIDYCVKENAVLLTDDLRLWHYVYSPEVKSRAINSFIFFQEALSLAALDKRQYSLVLGELADYFYHFLPFNGEDLLNIVLDDLKKIEINRVAWMSFKYGEYSFKIARRTYHLLNQIKLPGSIHESFLSVCLEFLNRFVRLSVLEEDKIYWVLFLTNFFEGFIPKDRFKPYDELLEKHIGFVARAWGLLIKNLPKKSWDQLVEVSNEIKNEYIRHAVQSSLRHFIEHN